MSDHLDPSISFNEAAGFTRRKHYTRARSGRPIRAASMRPPDLPGGNQSSQSGKSTWCSRRFNEAAGFTRRKLEHYVDQLASERYPLQ